MSLTEEFPWLSGALGALEAGATIGTGAITEPIAGYVGLTALAQGRDPAAAVNMAREQGTYMPRTQAGREALQTVGTGLERLMNWGGLAGGPSTNDLVARFQTGVTPLGPLPASGLEALAIGAMDRIPGSRSARMSSRLLDEDITPEQYRDQMIKRGYLTQEEAELMPRGREQAIARTITQNPGMDPAALAEMAVAGWPKLGWYRNSANALVDVFGPEDSKRFAYLLSALSPQTSVESNLKNAVNTWTNWVRAGRPTDEDAILQIMGDSVEGDKGVESVLGAWRNNAFRALTEENVDDIRFSGPKVSSFARNLVGQLGEVTNDAWMAKAMDVNQDIFGGATSKAYGSDQFGALGGQGAGYTAANAVTREAADILTRRLRDQGIAVEPAEIQETVWSLAKSLWETRDAPGEMRTMTDIFESGSLAPERINETPDFGTLLATTPEYREALSSVGGNFDNLRPHIYPAESPAPRQAPLRRGLGRLEDRYRAEAVPTEVKRAAGNILRGSEYYTEPGRLSSPRFLEGGRGRPIDVLPDRARRMESLGMSTPRAYLLEPSEQNAELFARQIQEAKAADRFGSSVWDYSPEEYAQMQTYLLPEGAGFALKDDDIVSAFKNPEARIRGYADYMLPLAIQQGGRRLDAFDTVLPALYSRAGFRPTSRIPFDPSEAPPDWDYGIYDAFNEGRPDVVMMALDPENADIIQPSRIPYRSMSGRAKQRRESLLMDYDDAVKAQEEAVQEARQRGNRLVYPRY